MTNWLIGLLVTATLFFGGADAFNACRAEQPAAARIAPGDVRWANLDAFEAQVRADLPIGTPKSNVDTYLRGWGIPYGYSEPNTGLGENSFMVTIKNIGPRMGFTSYLVIRIQLDASKRVSSIDFHVEYDAP